MALPLAIVQTGFAGVEEYGRERKICNRVVPHILPIIADEVVLLTPDLALLRKTPLFDLYENSGARVVDFAGWALPVEYSGLMAEHAAVRTAAGLFDVSHMGELELHGRDAAELVQFAITNDAGRLETPGGAGVPGRAIYTPMCEESGGTVDDLLVYRLAPHRFLLIVNAANTETDRRWLVRLAQERGLEVAVEDRSSGLALLALQGPRAESILQELTDFPLSQLKAFRFVPTAEVGGVEALVSRSGYTGEDGFELLVEAGAAVDLWRRLMAAGGAGILPAGLGARDTLRLESALALYGHELNRDTNPLEARLDRFVRLEQGDFVGRDAIRAAREHGLRKLLVGLELSDRGIARHGHLVVAQGRQIGAVTSGTYSPTLRKSIALAFVEPAHAGIGGMVAVRIRDRDREARVVPVPFYRREQVRGGAAAGPHRSGKKED